MESRFFGRRFSPVNTLRMIKECKGMRSYHEKTNDRKNYIQGLGVFIGDPLPRAIPNLRKISLYLTCLLLIRV